MKKIIAFVSMLAVAGAASGQGLINFTDGAVGLNAPVSDVNNVKLSGVAYLADLFYGPVGTATSALTDLGLHQAFATGGSAGYFFGGGITLPVPGGTSYEFQVRVWQASAGATWAAATGSAGDPASANGSTYASHGGTQWGASNPFNVTPATAPSPSATLIGLNAFQLTPVPEPTTLALGGLGAAALLLFRRRKN